MAPSFCADCGNILDISSKEIVDCDCCGNSNKNNVHKTRTTTTTNPDKFPSILRNKLSSTQPVTEKDFENTQKISRECPNCNAKEMTWFAVQLRGADEGTTVFYRCTCGYRGKEDN